MLHAEGDASGGTPATIICRLKTRLPPSLLPSTLAFDGCITKGQLILE